MVASIVGAALGSRDGVIWLNGAWTESSERSAMTNGGTILGIVAAPG